MVHTAFKCPPKPLMILPRGIFTSRISSSHIKESNLIYSHIVIDLFSLLYLIIYLHRKCFSSNIVNRRAGGPMVEWVGWKMQACIRPAIYEGALYHTGMMEMKTYTGEETNLRGLFGEVYNF